MASGGREPALVARLSESGPALLVGALLQTETRLGEGEKKSVRFVVSPYFSVGGPRSNKDLRRAQGIFSHPRRVGPREPAHAPRSPWGSCLFAFISQPVSPP